MDFHYRARNKNGTMEEDTITVASRQAALGELRARGLLPVELTEKKPGGFSVPDLKNFLGHVSLIDKLTFIKNLGVMIRSGVPVSRALRILSMQSTNKKFQDVILDLSKNVETGVSLSQSFAKHPEIFSGLYVSLVEVGEASGNLDENLDYLATLLQRENELMRKTKGALTYPLVVLATLVLVGILMFIFVLPKLTSTFTELNVELPPLTRALIAMVNLFSHNTIVAVLGLIVLIGGSFFALRSPAGRLFSQKAFVTLPIIAGITKKINLARFTLTLGMLMKSSMQIVPALAIVSKGLGNRYFSEAVSEAAGQVKVGVSLSASLEKHPKLFPPLLVQMIKVGEEAGTVEEILKQMGDYYEAEVDQIMKNMSSIIEPLMVVVIGAAVAVMALALIMPIYSITQAV